MGTLKQCHIFRKLRLLDPPPPAPDSIPFASVLSLMRKRDFSSRLGTKLLTQQNVSQSKLRNPQVNKTLKAHKWSFFFPKDFNFTCFITKFFCNFSRQLVTGKSGHLIQPQPFKDTLQLARKSKKGNFSNDKYTHLACNCSCKILHACFLRVFCV